MAYTLTQAVTEVRYLLNEGTASFWTDTEIQGWIQQGTLDISTKSLCTTDEGTITLATGQMKYTSSDEAWISSLLKCEVVWYDFGQSMRGLQRIEPHMMGHLQIQTAGAPRYFYEDGKRFYIWPTPSSAENGKELTAVYSKLTTDITELREELQYLAIWYATSMAKAKDRKFEEAALYQQLYLNALNFERQDKHEMGTMPTSTFKQP